MPLPVRGCSMTDLFTSVSRGNRAEFDAYLERGGDINLTNKNGVSLLHQALIDDNLEKMSLLISKGCNVSTFNKNNCSPVHLAIANDDYMVVKMLLEAGADVNQPLYHGMSALVHAVKNNNRHIIKLILKKSRNCDVNLECDNSTTALSKAVLKRGMTDVCELLLRHGATLKSVYYPQNRMTHVREMGNNEWLMDIILKRGRSTGINYHHHLMMACLLRKMYMAEKIISHVDDPFTPMILGAIAKYEDDRIWEPLLMCVVRSYKFATNCSPENRLLTLMLDFCQCRQRDTPTVIRNHSMRAIAVIRLLREYGLVIHPETRTRSCASDCECRQAIHTALQHELAEVHTPVVSLKGQCCSVIRQSLPAGDGVSTAVVDTLPLPQTLKQYIRMADAVPSSEVHGFPTFIYPTQQDAVCEYVYWWGDR